MGSRYEGRHDTRKKPWGAALAIAGALFSGAGGAWGQSQDPYYNDPNRPLAENIRRFNEAQARRRAEESRMSRECRGAIAAMEADIIRGPDSRGMMGPNYDALYEGESEVDGCSRAEADRLRALDQRLNRRGNGDEPADRAQ